MRLLIFLYPWLELLSLVQLGIETSAWVPLFWVAAMIMVGGALLRRVGMASVERLRTAQSQGLLQQHLLVDDLAVAVAALLLIIPGLLSDFFALVMLIGPLRRRVARWLGMSGPSTAESEIFDSANTESRGRVTLEGDFKRLDDD